jgi:hypothetical protein
MPFARGLVNVNDAQGFFLPDADNHLTGAGYFLVTG